MQGEFKSPSLYIKRRFAKGVQRNTTDFFKAWITTDRITWFFYYTLYSSIRLLHLQNSERSFQNCGLRYNFLHAALHCSSFCLMTTVIRSWYVQRCLLLKDSVFVLRINKLKCSLKTNVSLVLATETSNCKWSHKSDVMIVTSFIRTPLWYGHFALSLRCPYKRGSTVP